ncbi:hypothetical protein U0035_00055 [Niabella yanshanensis]|uniref:Uncharacterized protein n=1 Tax=Niabella yanshanensis TaxID=577386 RepID=A0ABZ0WAG2_9BACT|nr:hypothetical protein [Niabella yanshanensis]WQD38537.1 hypothetical protein U0035_00055 [Niabella yanshanensis]
MKIKSFIVFYWSVMVMLFFCACKKTSNAAEEGKGAGPGAERVTNFNNVVGVDHFGRTFGSISSMKTDKQVGLFFWLWIGQPHAGNIYDASKILAMPNGLKLLTDFEYQDESISPNGQAHFWGEPIWGYYNSEDEWVLRKQVEMLTIAGIDFIYFDATNAFIYKNVFMKLLAIIDEYQKNGFSPPKVAFYTHSRSFQTTRELYRELYQPGLFPDTWYRVSGKPMIIAYTNPEDDLNEARSRGDQDYTPGVLPPDILGFFHFYRPQWPGDPVYPDGFPWVEWIHPQPMHNGVMNVTVASHPNVPMSFSLTRPNEMTNWGRGWNPFSKQNNAANVDKGTFFQTQWDYAIAAEPKMISIGGWNEWIAYKQPYWNEYVMVDAVNKEYSRDIEPMRGGYQDAFYMQMIQNIRKYKGVSNEITASGKTTIDITAGEEPWKRIPYTAVNISKNRYERNSSGAATITRYTQPAPENHIQEVKVAHDDQQIYFLIRGRNSFSNPGGKFNWVNILIGTGVPSLKAWEGYEYLIGKTYASGQASVGKLQPDFKTIASGAAKYTINGNVLQISCPKVAVGLNGSGTFYFKVAADVAEPQDIMSYYTSGSSLPLGRLSYAYAMGN